LAANIGIICYIANKKQEIVNFLILNKAVSVVESHVIQSEAKNLGNMKWV